MTNEDRRPDGAVVCAAGMVVLCLVWGGCGAKPEPPKAVGAGTENETVSAPRLFAGEDLDNWPTANPTSPPSDKRFESVPPAKLIPFVLGDAHETPDGRPMSQILACAWFIWKTRDDPKLRAELADRIAARLLASTEKKPDHPYLASFLGPLLAHDHILSLLRKVKTLDCCYGPELLRSLSQCWKPDDLPLIVPLMDKETDACRGLINDTLRECTSHDVPWTSAEECAKAWMTWYRQRKPEARNRKPD